MACLGILTEDNPTNKPIPQWISMGFTLVASVVFGMLMTACADNSQPGLHADSIRSTETKMSRPDEHELVRGAITENGYQAILGTGDLSPGRHRIGFVLLSPEGVVSEPTLVATLYEGEADSNRKLFGPFVATYRPWPMVSRGIYTAVVNFDSPGMHRVEIVTNLEDGRREVVELAFNVAMSVAAPGIGEEAIPSVTKTVEDVKRPSELTTGSFYDPDLYQLTIADAVSSGQPVVVVFASPAFCINAVCGPQVEVLSELQNVYGDQCAFIHVDLYEKPHEIQGNLGEAVISRAVWEWNLPSNEWTFVIDSDGTVAARFEAFATFSEIEAELLKLLP